MQPWCLVGLFHWVDKDSSGKVCKAELNEALLHTYLQATASAAELSGFSDFPGIAGIGYFGVLQWVLGGREGLQ